MLLTKLKPTIDDVARVAEVSIGTVSRVINERPGVKESTRERVLEVMKQLGYAPDLAARQLSLGKPIHIGLSVPSHNRRLIPFFLLFWEALTKPLEPSYRLEEIPSGADGLPEELCEGMILFGAHDDDPRIHYLKEKQIPVVLLGRSHEVNAICPDDYSGGRQATEHLLRLGHEHIVHVSD